MTRPQAPPGNVEAGAPKDTGPIPDTTPADQNRKPASTIRQGMDEKRRACRHVRVRFCPSCVVERRRASDELNAMCPRPRPVPCTFGLEPRELRREFARMIAAGWTRREAAAVLAVLDVEQVSAP
jgi:hypothetical protein